jgi:hypothetical protein
MTLPDAGVAWEKTSMGREGEFMQDRAFWNIATFMQPF